uniref:Uncharacterized protein n=1 Tax=viral metagenome TaxID=1070528 RepID=A0A6H2A0Y0_9ZZZZ
MIRTLFGVLLVILVVVFITVFITPKKEKYEPSEPPSVSFQEIMEKANQLDNDVYLIIQDLLLRVHALEMKQKQVPAINIYIQAPDSVRIFPINGELIVDSLEAWEAVENKEGKK